MFYKGDHIQIRLPYGLLGVSHPSSQTVLFDEHVFMPTGDDQINTRKIDSIEIQVTQDQNEDITASYPLIEWDIPQYEERLKDGFESRSKYFGKQ